MLKRHLEALPAEREHGRPGADLLEPQIGRDGAAFAEDLPVDDDHAVRWLL